MRHLKIDPANAYLFQRLAAHVLYSDISLRGRSAVLALNTKAGSPIYGLMALGGSADRSYSYQSRRRSTESQDRSSRPRISAAERFDL